MPTNPITSTRPAEVARVAAGLTLEQAAKAADVSARYLRSVELGSRPFTNILAETLANVYAAHGNNCGINPFFLPAKSAASKGEASRQGARSASKPQHKEVAGKTRKAVPDVLGEGPAERRRQSAGHTQTPANTRERAMFE